METNGGASSDKGLTLETIAKSHAEIGARVVELVSDYMRRIEETPVCPSSSPQELDALFDEPLPREGEAASEILERYRRDIESNSTAIPSPRYFGLFNPTPLPIAVWADALASCLNQNGAVWRNSPAMSVMETRVIKWFCELIGYDERGFGTLTSGGSEANLVAIKCARDCVNQKIKERGLRSAASGDLMV